MAKSPLATATYPAAAGNFTKGRPQGKPDHITVHHMAGVLSAKQCGGVFQKAGRKASASYGIGNGGEIANYVDEADTPWSDSNWNSNCKTISIETSNCATGGDWPIGAAAFNSLIKLVADIAKRNGLGHLEPGRNLCWHSMYTSTTCVPINTEVLTKNGWKSIHDVEEGEDIATAHIDDLSISFSPVLAKVPEKKQDTWETRGVEVTADHRMLWKTQGQDYWRVSQFKDLPNDAGIYIPSAGRYAGRGLPLSDDEIKLLVAVQADGHYEHGDHSGNDRVTFHVSKGRKIALLDEMLSKYEHNKYLHADGTVSYNVHGIKPLCDRWLEDKKFTFEWLEMSPEQARFFLDTLLDFDGCRSGNDYSSSIQQNIDVVDAIASINGVGVRHNGNRRTAFVKSARTITKESDKKRHQQTKVSCVTVASGFILIRQHGRTTIVGNCPGNYLRSKMQELADKANAINEGQPRPEPAPQPQPQPTPSGLKVGDKVVPTKWVDWNGTPLAKTRDFYYLSELNGARAVLRADSMTGAVYAAINVANLKKYDGTTPAPAPTPAPAGFKVGDQVVPTKLVDYNGRRLAQYDPSYTITELSGDRAVLSARGTVWAAMNTANIRKA